MPRSFLRPALFFSLAATLGALSCATGVIIPGTTAGAGGASGGAGGAAGVGGAAVTTTTQSSGTSTSSTGAGGCVHAADCAMMNDACNVGTCINSVCQKMPGTDGTGCDDGQFCTDNDSCAQGVCLGGSQKFCPSADTCNIGVCDESSKSCKSTPGNEGGQCVSKDPCIASGLCVAGSCSGGVPVDCSLFNGPCTVGVCDKVAGCTVKPKADGAACDDGLYCTVSDVCTGGTCAGKPNTCAAPGDVCMIGTCNEAMKSCVAVPGNDGAVCDDMNACTTGEKCGAGKCSGGVPANQAGACDDKSACTTADTCNAGVCTGTAVVQCKNGDGCCPAGCTSLNDDDCKLINVGVMGNGFYTDGLRAFLETQQFIKSAVKNTSCALATLKTFDVVIVYGNMDCFDAAAFDQYVAQGGGIIGTPWTFNNNKGFSSLPVSGQSGPTVSHSPLAVQVTDPNDVLLQGVVFNNGDDIGHEQWTFTLKPGATNAVIWNNDPAQLAAAKWATGLGRAVYLNFHYITSDCGLAIQYDWGKKLIYNATLWAGKAI